MQSLDRALNLLELLHEAGGRLSLSALAAASELPVPTIHRLLRTLIARGFAVQETSRLYALGPRLIPLGELTGRLLGSQADEYLRGLVASTGETAAIATLGGGGRVVYLNQMESGHLPAVRMDAGLPEFPQSSAIGRALLAQVPDEQVLALISGTAMPAVTPRAPVNPTTLLEELKRIRELGFANDDGDQVSGLRSIAAPIRRGETILAIGIVGTAECMTDAVVKHLAPLIRDTAIEISLRWPQGHGSVQPPPPLAALERILGSDRDR